MKFILSIAPSFQEIASTRSSHAKLKDFRVNMEGNKVILIFDFQTCDAAGQNMVTLCTESICEHIVEATPIQPDFWYIESNYSGDKKATAVSFSNVRGKKVIAESIVKKEIVKKVLRSTPEEISKYWLTSSICSIESGSIGIQGHFANGLAAIFIACGQDVVCVAESFVGVTRMEVNEDGDLYISVTLPSLVVGTVGGGTWLPTQKECLEMIDCSGNGKARKFAEICAATVLCGELSIAVSIASGDFAKAHKLFGRKKS
jgi:hydroxymethylglutaryl-CoA reductase (NADPH)